MIPINASNVSLHWRLPGISPENAIAAETDLEARTKIFDAEWVQREFEAAWESADATLELGDL